ncbi:ThuA domain-containing protein [Catenovulum sediminis]|uniref:ThuA domain-containing protein n=2 Tax=Catenovulum sediminis TaxID=1740262 RepID=A0ABV1RD53_9ALTE
MAKQFKALVFTKTNGWHHESILDGVQAMRRLAERHHFDMEWHEDPSRLNAENLKQFDVIVFLSTTGDIFNAEQKRAIEAFIQSGKGFVGIHSASDTEHNWQWYTKLVGHTFYIHPEIQTARLKVENKFFPGLEHLPEQFLWTDEYYEFSEGLNENLNYILTVDENSYSTDAQWGELSAKGMGDFHPIAWYQQYDGGRSFYTALGHMPAAYQQEIFLNHLYGGVYWAATGKGMLNQ